jgi:hypothetical protein
MKKNLAVAYGIKRRSKSKMAEGGMVDKREPANDINMDKRAKDLSFEDDEGMQISMNAKNYAHGGEVDEHYDSIADAILAKKRRASEEKAMEHEDNAAGEFLMDRNEDAVLDNGQEDIQDEDLVSSIMRKRRS